jgi:histidinol-phosphate/aromatic aminotransferase/cobyric acid decarboxylase-like protein
MSSMLVDLACTGQVGGAQQVQQQEQLQGTGMNVAEQLDAAAAQAAAQGHPVRAVLLANPNNPLGFV